MTPEQKQALEEMAENKRQAVSMVAGLSAQVTTAALGMIALLGAYVAFAADKKECKGMFWPAMGLSFALFVFSAICGGAGTAILIGKGARGRWIHTLGNRCFKKQTYSCLFGVIFFVLAVLTAGKDKSEAEGERHFEELKQQITQLQNQVLELKQANEAARLSQIKTNTSPRNTKSSPKAPTPHLK